MGLSMRAKRIAQLEGPSIEEFSEQSCSQLQPQDPDALIANGFTEKYGISKPQVTLVPDQGGPAGGGDERVRHLARGGQPEDDPGADPAAHVCAGAQGAAAARVPGLQETVVRDAAGGGAPRRDSQPPGLDLRPQWRHRHLGQE
jgi:hypothetical protein